MNGATLISAVKRKIEKDEKTPDISDNELAEFLGITYVNLWSWKRRKSVTPRQIASLLGKARRAAAKRAEGQVIRPLVEFLELTPSESRSGAATELFSAGRGPTAHPYLAGLKSELAKAHGIYIFYDSRGRALYVGKAKQQKLWSEMRNAFNRNRGDLQKVKRVKHPKRRQQFKTDEEKRRQISEHSVPLHEIATYVSAYAVSDGLVNELEALLVRGFANDILNKRMENFVGRKSA